MLKFLAAYSTIQQPMNKGNNCNFLMVDDILIDLVVLLEN